MMTVLVEQHDDEKVFIKSDFPMRDKELIMSLPGSSYNVKDHMYYAPLTWATCRALRGIFGEDLEVGLDLRTWAWHEHTDRISPALALRNAWAADGDEDLYPFQRAGVQFLSYAQRALLCDDMGTGKTVQTIRTLKELLRRGEKPFPALVVCPNSMVLVWRNEIKRWWPGARVSVIRGSAAKRREAIKTPAHFYIINFESVRMHSRLSPFGSIRLKRCIVCMPTLADVPANSQTRCEHCKKELNQRQWHTLIVDEVHRIKDPKSKQARATWALRNEETKFVFGLTGTPIGNAPSDLWSALHLISPKEWPARTKYIDRYCLTQYNPFSAGVTVIGLRNDNKQEFFDIVDPRMRRMPKEAVLPHLPKKTYSTRYVEMSSKQKKAYDQMEAGMIALLGDDEGIAVAQNPLVQMTRMMQFASAYAEIDENGQVRLTNPSCKVDALVDLLEDMGEEPLVVFAQSRQLIDLAIAKMAELKIHYRMIVGGQSSDDRERAKEDFQNGYARVILCTIAAGGIGITLTRAAAACFLQRSYSAIDNSQAEDRVHRIGSEIHDKVEIIDIVAIGTIEERQRLLLGEKYDRLEEVVRDRETMRRLLGAKK